MSLLQKYYPQQLFVMSLQEQSDSELIRDFVDNGNQSAFDALLRRHYQRLHRRIAGKIRDQDQAHDLCQTLWMRVLSNLPDYRDDQKFEHYLNTIASNLMKDHWRGDRSDQEVSLYDDEGEDNSDKTFASAMGESMVDEERKLINREAIDTLITKVIPSLSSEQRLVYLLRHESEFWDEKQPFQWQHLAELNGMEVEQAAALFEQVRDKLVRQGNGAAEDVEINAEETLVFMLWTQAHRLDKSSKLTEQYFADLLNMPVNTFKTRYRASLKAIAEGMAKWQ